MLIDHSAWRQSESSLSHNQGRHHPDDASDGCSSRSGEHPRELRGAGDGLHTDDEGPRHDGRDETSQN